MLSPLSVIPLRRLFLRNQNEFTFGDQECSGRSEFSPRAPQDCRSLHRSEQTLALRQIVQCLVPESQPPSPRVQSNSPSAFASR